MLEGGLLSPPLFPLPFSPLPFDIEPIKQALTNFPPLSNLSSERRLILFENKENYCLLAAAPLAYKSPVYKWGKRDRKIV